MKGLAALSLVLPAAGELSQALGRGRLSHAYLFLGDPARRLALAEAFAKAVLCLEGGEDACGICTSCRKFDHDNHEDLLQIRREGNTIKTDVIRKTLADLLYKPFGQRKVLILDDADLMTTSGQNRLLKTLEEPPGQAILLLLAQREEALLPTVRSRCIRYLLESDEEKEEGAPQALARAFWDRCLETEAFHRRLSLVEPLMADRPATLAFLEAMEENLSKRLRSQPSPGALKDLQRVAQAGEAVRQNHRIGYALKGLCLALHIEDSLEDTHDKGSWRTI